ncbi:hypothetical protein [uncultured Devosia sp.]|uniref:hypothetical protein n=1 Tax=uncultured Devosia sp. TaxID=211434 RepID=UPI0035C95284
MRALRLLAFTGAALVLTGCIARPVGDFGRADPSFTHDVAMPTVGRLLADARDEPVSDFNQTDQETEMHNRVWRFLVASHAKDWFYDTAVELQRTRLTGPTDGVFETDRYYQWLKQTQYQSSRTRYSTVGRHIAADIDTLPTTFLAICLVQEIDRQRAVALNGLSGLEPEVAADVEARRIENTVHINWFVRALTYRDQSYGYALDHLLVETPHEQSLAVDEALRRLAVYVERAQRDDFCSGTAVTSQSRHDAIPSRYGQRSYGVEVFDIK